MLHQIGIGTLGPVFRTYEPTRDRLVAVKVFRLDIVPEQAQALADALGRAAQASLFHPSIVEPIAAGVEGTLAYRAEEYVAAESLDVAMRHYAPASLDKALPFVTQLAGAIDFARAAGVGHGGLHPRDIFVTPDEARATGFGVVEALEAVGIRAPIRRPYTAPERIDGIRWGVGADIFSLAAIAFELLTGRRPSGTGAQIGALPDGPHSAAIHAVLARAMDDDFSKRYPTALAFASALEAAGRSEESVPTAAAAVAAAPIVVAAATPVAPPARVVPPPGSVAPAAKTPGEFEVEKKLDPVLTAIDDDIAAERELDEADVADRTLFDEPLAFDERSEDVEAESFADLGEVDTGRFADEFVEEQRADAEGRRPLEAVHETIAPAAAARETTHLRMFQTDQPLEPEPHEHADPSRPSMLTFTLGLIVGLLAGFGGAYFVFAGDRDRPATQQASAPASAPKPSATSPSAPAAGAATPDKPGNYSEQRVASAPQQTPAPPAVAPPIPQEGTAPARSSSRGSARATPATTRGRLVVTSTPTRASVTINGTWRGRTPLTLDDLAFGRYVVRVVQTGYATARDEFTLSAQDASHQFSPRLERETAAGGAGAREPATAQPPRGGVAAPPGSSQAFTGSLYVDSRPRGATVFVDGRSVGKTPLSVPDVAIGSHVVRIEMAGKQPWTTTTRVVAGEMQRVTGSLEDRQSPHE